MFTKHKAGGYKKIIAGVGLKTLAFGKNTLLGKFRIEKGTVIPNHNHPHEQTGYLISGRLEFEIEGERTVAEPGDGWCLESNVVHGARALEECVVIEVFSPVREGYLP